MKAPARPEAGFSIAHAHRPAAWMWVSMGGLAVGTADMLFAMAWWAPLGAPPMRILQSIAAWVMGRDAAMAGGATTALFGALLYWYLMCAIVAGYHVAVSNYGARHDGLLLRRPLLCGAIYGAAWFVLIHLIAVPLFSLAPPRHFLPAWNLACLLAHMLLIGIPAALFARKWHGAG